MNTVEGNATGVTVAAETSQPDICGTSPIGSPQFELEAKPAPAAVSAAPAIITEEAVLFTTAAAVPVWPTTRHWWPAATHSLIAAMHHMLLTSTVDSREPRQDCRRHYGFLEYSCMARAMDRL
jgi:hypothetical protein